MLINEKNVTTIDPENEIIQQPKNHPGILFIIIIVTHHFDSHFSIFSPTKSKYIVPILLIFVLVFQHCMSNHNLYLNK